LKANAKAKEKEQEQEQEQKIHLIFNLFCFIFVYKLLKNIFEVYCSLCLSFRTRKITNTDKSFIFGLNHKKIDIFYRFFSLYFFSLSLSVIEINALFFFTRKSNKQKKNNLKVLLLCI